MHLNSLDYLSRHLKNTKVLSKKKVGELIKKYQAGDIEAGKKVVEHNIKYVLSISTCYVKKYGIDYDELVGYGVVGLYRAIKRFDPDRGFAFSTYSRFWIRQCILRKCLWKRDSVNNKTKPGVERYNFKSLDDTESWHGQNCTGTITEDKHKEVFIQRAIEEYIDKMPERTRSIMLLKYGFESGENMKLREIGKVHGICHERVRQLIEEQIRKMRVNKKIRKLVGK